MMDKAVYKNYVGLSNILFRVSNGTDASKASALLVNSHLVCCSLLCLPLENPDVLLTGLHPTQPGSRR